MVRFQWYADDGSVGQVLPGNFAQDPASNIYYAMAEIRVSFEELHDWELRLSAGSGSTSNSGGELHLAKGLSEGNQSEQPQFHRRGF